MITRFGMDEAWATSPSRRSGPAFSIHRNWPRRLPGGRIDPGAHRSGYPRIVMGVFERAYRILDINRAVRSAARASCWRGKRSTKAISVIDSRTCSELKTVVGAIQSKPRLCSVRHPIRRHCSRRTDMLH